MLAEIGVFGTALLALDVPFIIFVMSKQYTEMGLGIISWIYPVLAYLMMTLTWFLIQGDILKGALVGFTVFGVYAFTLLSILPKYKLSTALMEIGWGTVLFTTATLLAKTLAGSPAPTYY